MRLQELNVEELKCTNGGERMMPGSDMPMTGGTVTSNEDTIMAPDEPTMFSDVMNRLNTFHFKW